MKVEVFSDVVCPWCAVGKRRFEAALAQFEHADEIEVVWRAYELDPNAPAQREGDYAERLARKYGMIARPGGGGQRAADEARRRPRASTSTSSGSGRATPSTRTGSCTTPGRPAPACRTR